MSVKQALARGLSRAGRFLPLRRPPEGLRVLLFHAVGDELPSDPYGTALSVAAFREHLETLCGLRALLPSRPFSIAPHEGPSLAVTFDDGYRGVLRHAAPLLVERGVPFTLFVTSRFLDDASGLYLSPTELRELAALPGARVGAHGATHRRLTGLSDEELREELLSSRTRLEDLLGGPVHALSYPHGAVDRRVRDAAAAAGYALGGCSRYGSNPPGRDPLLLCRTEITSFDSPSDAELKALGYWDWYRLRHKDPAEML